MDSEGDTSTMYVYQSPKRWMAFRSRKMNVFAYQCLARVLPTFADGKMRSLAIEDDEKLDTKPNHFE